MEMLGSEYVMEHCILAYNTYIEQQLYREYVTDGLRCLSESVANYYGGTYLQKRYADIIHGFKEEEDERSADEIVLEVIEKAGLSVKR